MYKLTNIPQENNDIDKIYVSSNKKNILTTSKDGTLTIKNEQNEIIKKLKNHKGSIMDICFAPITLPSYIITIGYDRTLNLYNINDLTEKPLFTYHEESLEYGFFNHVSFFKSSKSILKFGVSTSNGFILTFSNENNFVPEKKQIYNNTITAFNCLNNGCIVTSAKNEKSRIYFDTYFSGFIEFGDELVDVKKNLFASYYNEDSVLNGVNEIFVEVKDRILLIWNFNNDDKEIKEIFRTKFDFEVLRVNFNFGGLSANVVLFDKSNGEFVFSRLESDYEGERQWRVEVLNLVNN